MVRFHYDFLSPYSYIASQLIRRDYADLELEYAPVVLGSILSKRGVKGPGEIPSRRRIGLQDALLLCSHYDIEFAAPPTHPFNSIYALRSVCAVPDDGTRARLTDAYFRAAWVDSEALDDMAVLTRCLEACGVDQDPEDVATTREHRATLKANTRDAIDRGVWGVPSFVVDDFVFFGHDRLPLLRAYLQGKLTYDPAQLDELLARPQPGRIV